MIRLFRPLAAAYLLAPALFATDPQVIQPAGAEKAVETRTLPASGLTSLKVVNVNGRIKVVPWDRDEVVFTGEFRPSSKDEQVKVVVTFTATGLEVRGEYPKGFRGLLPYRGPSVEMDLKVPRRLAAQLESVNGSVEVAGLQGDVACETVNGSVRAEDLNGALKAETVNGSIQVRQVAGRVSLHTVNGSIQAKDLDGQGRGLEAETVNGSVTLTLGKASGRLTASSVNGSVAFSAPGAQQVEAKKHKVVATLPGSDQAIKVQTVNGKITVS